MIRAAAFALGIVVGLSGLVRFHPTVSPQALAVAAALRKRR